MPPCPECQKPFFTLQGMRDHRRVVHSSLECGLCGKQGLSANGLLAHARAKHSKKFTKLFYACKACEYYAVDAEGLRQHYQTSPAHRKCDTCEEPYYDLPIFNSLVMFKPLYRGLSRCDDCGRLTLQTQIYGDPIEAEAQELGIAEDDEEQEASDGYATAGETDEAGAEHELESIL
ncbi:hypothetical protein PsYK624_025500 [Phanerochaete sordida]|uniref:C2H2-type domain-containing protein n=1 Tax=Phanerochaete sordida TaxID=48140 RepID=A0A9P3L8U8_9APHY|nr:hypothetical protein PsYK624_025500 [Phanerochaete sordida]